MAINISYTILYTVYTSIIIAFAILTTIMIPISNVFATGIRHDPGDEATTEEAECFVNGYDSGFAGKYDKDRARECVEHNDQYNEIWAKGCDDSTRTEVECGDLINNPVKIQDFKALKSENDRTCYDAGAEDGKAGKPFNKERDDGCYEFTGISNGYEGGYQFGCETHTTQATCELLYEEKQYYCPDHPDIVGCVDFLHNATNKKPAEVPCPGGGCFKDQNAEKYCLGYNDTFCKTIGDLCDADGFVRPEYPYCKTD